MDEDEFITVRWELTLPPEVVSFIEFEAKRLTEEQRRANPDSPEIITTEKVASELLHGAALMAYLELPEKMSDEDFDRYLPMIRRDHTE